MHPTKIPTITKQLECNDNLLYNDTNGIKLQSFIFTVNNPNIGTQFTISDNNNNNLNVKSLYIENNNNSQLKKMINNTYIIIFDINNDELIIGNEYKLFVLLNEPFPSIFKIHKHCLTNSPTNAPTVYFSCFFVNIIN